MKATTFTFIVGLMLGLIVWLTFELIKTYEPQPTANRTELSFCYPNYNLTIENLHAEIKKQGIYFDTIVLCQSILETGWFTSYNCTKRNNLFGMTGGKKTESNTHGYAIYRTWQESVKAYKDWQVKRLNYYDFLNQQHYHESKDYEWKCESIRQGLFRDFIHY